MNIHKLGSSFNIITHKWHYYFFLIIKWDLYNWGTNFVIQIKQNCTSHSLGTTEWVLPDLLQLCNVSLSSPSILQLLCIMVCSLVICIFILLLLLIIIAYWYCSLILMTYFWSYFQMVLFPLILSLVEINHM